MRRSIDYNLEDYREIVGDTAVSNIHRKARRLYGKHILHINTTYQGGGVAEILSSLLPLMNDVGIDAGWRLIHGNPDFFSVTKKFHNALQGEPINLTEIKKRLYIQTNQYFSLYTHISHDCVIIHDPQPLPLIEIYKKRQPWIWRCHVDLSDANKALWDFFKNFLLKFDLIIVSSEDYKREDLPVDQIVICPAIDPLSPKNMEISVKTMEKYLSKNSVPTDKPILTQISRFDKWKDPLGVIEVYKRVKQAVDCRLVLCGGMAPDDPEGWMIYERVRRKANRLIDNGDIILITSENHILVNALQRVSTVIIQKSLREGFGLTVTEGLWKGRPVVASSVGGIRHQIQDGENGFLVAPHDIDGFADRIIHLIKNPDAAHEIGRKGKEYARERFLITRLLSDYLDIIDRVTTIG
jgi:trehalose synthase